MITLKLKINNISDNDKLLIINNQQNYSYAFRKLFSNFKLINDKDFLNNLCKKYNIPKYLLNCLK